MRYEILGNSLPVVVCHLNPGEAVITESGSMSWMSPVSYTHLTDNKRKRRVLYLCL